MTGFILGALLLSAGAIALLVRPLLRRPASADFSRAQLNTAIYRDQIAELERDRAEGALSQADYDAALAELQRRMLEEVADATPATAGAPADAPVGKALPVALGGSVLVGAALFYLAIGTPQAIDPPPQRQDGHIGMADIERMVAGMAAKLENEPDNHRGWAMLARSYKVLERYPDAVRAYERTGPLLDSSAELLVDYADAQAVVDQGFSPKVLALIDKALKLDPANLQGLWLRGTAAFEAKQYGNAVADWEQLLALLPPDSEEAGIVRGNISQAKALGGAPAGRR